MKIKLLIILIFISLFTYSQEKYTDIVYLANGDRVSGMIIDRNDSAQLIKLNLKKNEVITIYYDEISRIEGHQINKSDNKTYKSLGIGFGNSYGEIGLLYQQKIDSKIAWAYHLGIGIYPDFYGVNPAIWYNAGLKLYTYKWVYVDVTYGVIERNYYREAYKNELGTSLLIGADWFIYNKIGLNAAFGIASVSDREKVAVDYLVIDIGIFIKLGKK